MLLPDTLARGVCRYLLGISGGVHRAPLSSVCFCGLSSYTRDALRRSRESRADSRFSAPTVTETGAFRFARHSERNTRRKISYRRFPVLFLGRGGESVNSPHFPRYLRDNGGTGVEN